MLATLIQLRNQPFFEPLQNNELEKAIACLQLKTTTIEANTHVDIDAFKMKIGLVLAGHLFIKKHTELGEQSIVTSVEKGELIWPEQLGLTRDHLIIVKKQVHLLTFEQANFSDTCPLRSFIYQQLLAQALHQNQMLIKRVDLLGNRRLRERVLTFLNQQDAVIGDPIIIPYSREELAHYLHVDRSALSRELANMKRDGLITYHLNTFTLLG